MNVLVCLVLIVFSGLVTPTCHQKVAFSKAAFAFHISADWVRSVRLHTVFFSYQGLADIRDPPPNRAAATILTQQPAALRHSSEPDNSWLWACDTVTNKSLWQMWMTLQFYDKTD